MGQPIPSQHPSVVLRSHYKAVRALLVVAMAALIALAAAVVILADDDKQASISTAQPSVQQQALPSGTRFDGGPDEGTRGAQAIAPTPGTRFDGGPDEGTRGAQAIAPAPGTRFDGGPDEGTRGAQAQSVETWTRSSYQPAPADGFKDRAGGPSILGGPRP